MWTRHERLSARVESGVVITRLNRANDSRVWMEPKLKEFLFERLGARAGCDDLGQISAALNSKWNSLN
jgi:hypothetical protein